MKKRTNRFAVACFALGTYFLFEGFGGIAFLRERLGMVDTYASELTEFTLFHSEHLTSADDLILDGSNSATHFKEMSSCHQTIPTSRCYQILEDTFNIVPAAIIETIYNYGFEIMLLGNDIRELVRLETNWDPGYYYSGVTFPGYEGYTQIWSASKGGKSILIHEIGHAYDFSLGSLSSSEAFQALFQSEANKLFAIEPLYRSKTSEFFAESFKLYLTMPWRLKLFAPKTYVFFEDLFQAM